MVKRTLASCLALCSLGMMAQSHKADSLKTVDLDEVNVISTRAGETTPVAHTNVSKEQIAELNTGKDLPFLLSMTPSVTLSSDAGNGIGYTTLRVRGVDPSRINITANGIPLNDAESAQVYWVNIPDFASSAENVQIQRGAGTSTNGAGAFGATVNIQTAKPGMVPSFGFDVSGGSYGSNKETFRFSTGLLKDHWAVQGRLSHISSDGYIDRASVKLNSYFLQGGYYDDNTVVKFITFNGQERTYHAWNYTSKYEQSLYGRTYNSCGEYYTEDGERHYYKDQTDNYHQQNYQLLWNQIFTPELSLNVGLHYTKGQGYYEQYKAGKKLYQFGLVPSTDGTKGDLINRKQMDNDFYGFIASLNYDNKQGLTASLGGGWNNYDGDHFGKVIWVKSMDGTGSSIQREPVETAVPSWEYYRNRGFKTDGNIYLRASENLSHGLRAFADLQYRHIGYRITGNNDKWDWTASPEHLQTLDIDEPFSFFNPKAGLNWQIDAHSRAYASFAVAQKEPTRNNYTDGLFLKHPTSEKLYDWELGYEYRSGNFTAGANFYYMNYKDQLVLNGKINEIGELMAENVPNSYRMGVELMAGYRFTDWLRWDVNATFSRNRIKDYVGYVSDYDADTWDDMWTQTEIHAGNTAIAFSPSVTLGSIIALDYKGFTVNLQSQYVSRQYLDNFERKEDSLDPCFVNNLDVAYTFKLHGIRSITVGATIYNLFDEKYETNGYSMTGAMYPAGSKENSYSLYSDPRFYPMAGINALGHVTFRF